MDFIKKNKYVILAVLIFLVFVLFLAKVMSFFSPEETHAIYGSRLNDAVELSNDTKDSIKENLKGDNLVSKVTVRVSGRIIDVTITVSADTSKDAAKQLGSKITEKLNENQLKYYDIQLFVKKDTDSADFPIIGYKQRNKDNFSWTKDR